MQYRNNGAIGALLDEYERALSDLKKVIADLSTDELTLIRDHKTKDEDCKSIGTILVHVIRAGYHYARVIRTSFGENQNNLESKVLVSSEDYILALDTMFAFNEQLFADFPNIKLEEPDNDKKLLFSWGQRYDVEQIMEHAIVHILRHRRQIERFLKA